MNVKNLMLLLTFTGLAVSCSNDEIDNDTPTIAGRSEIQIEMSGTSESQEYTKAIASTTENEIDKLQVYLFAAKEQAGPYYYLETWTEGTAYNPEAPSTNFKKQASGTGWKASLYPGELKGVPYIKLFCVANNGSSVTTDGAFYNVDGTTKVLDGAALVAVTTNPDDGTITNAAAATTEAAFLETYTKIMKNEADTKDIIQTPLLMTGDGQTKISGSVSKVNITLRRAMARFDIDNTTSKSRLTIKTVTLGHARKTGAVWPLTTKLAAVTDKETELMTYAPVPFDGPTANNGVRESALYVYPALASDECYLIIDGTYKSPVNNQDVAVTYNVPIQKTVGDKAEYIDIKANSRYQLSITDVTQAAIYGSFEVVDWTSGGGLNIKPDNDAPIFDALNGFSIADGGAAGDLPVAITDAEGVASTTEFKVVDNKSFKVTIAATGKVRAEKNAVTKAETTADAWLVIEDPTYEEKDGVWYTTFVISSENATGQQPVAVTFINEAASYDPDLWTTLTFYGPLAAPKLSDGGDGSLGNSVDYTTAPTAPTATMYKVKDSYILVKAMCIEGTKVVVPVGFAEAEIVKTEGNETIYKIKIDNVSSLGSDPISIQNAEDENVKTDIAVTLKEAKMTAPTLDTDATNIAEITGDALAYTIKTDIDELGSNSYTLKITSPQGVDVTLPTGKWLDVTEKTAFSAENGYTEYTVKKSTSVTDYTDFNIEFTNKLDATEKLTVTMKKAYSKPKLTAATEGTASTFNSAITFTDDYTATVDMYKAKDSKIYIKMTCDEAAAFATVDGLSITSKGNDNYEISVTDVSKFTSPTTAVTAQNSSETTRTATLTITWLDPAIDFSVTKDVNSAATKSGDAIDVVYATLDGGNFEITVTGPIGSTINYDAISESSWLGVNPNKKPAALTDAGDGTGSAIIGLKDDTGATTDPVVITITNKIDSDDTYKTKTITINKK